MTARPRRTRCRAGQGQGGRSEEVRGKDEGAQVMRQHRLRTVAVGQLMCWRPTALWLVGAC